METKEYRRIFLVVCVMLLVPLLGSIFSDSFNWGVGDYLVMGALLFAVGVLIMFARKKISSPSKRLVVIGGVILLALLIWVELAVDAVSKAIGFN
ncbi:MAG: hypothetical protein V4606_00630 [Patescibacteria group bacterium]